ncbi:Hypothetical protein FKW44_012612, partial [Caligus rogercresseyi]
WVTSLEGPKDISRLMKSRANHTNVRVGIMDNKDNEKDSLKLLLDEHFPESIENDPAGSAQQSSFQITEPLEDYFSAES